MAVAASVNSTVTNADAGSVPGLTTAGAAESAVSRVEGGAGTTVGGFGTGTTGFAGGGVGAGITTGGSGAAPSVPVAGRSDAPAAIVHRNGPGPAAAERQLQSIPPPNPVRRATTMPDASATVTVQARDEESLAWKRTVPPSTPLTIGE